LSVRHGATLHDSCYKATILFVSSDQIGGAKDLIISGFCELAPPTLSPMCISLLGKIPITPQLAYLTLSAAMKKNKVFKD